MVILFIPSEQNLCETETNLCQHGCSEDGEHYLCTCVGLRWSLPGVAEDPELHQNGLTCQGYSPPGRAVECVCGGGVSNNVIK